MVCWAMGIGAGGFSDLKGEGRPSIPCMPFPAEAKAMAVVTASRAARVAHTTPT